MSEIYRALVAVLFLAALVFYFARKGITERAIEPGDYARRRNVWLAITLLLFLSHDYWIFMIASGGVLLYAARREHNLLALLFVTVLAVPLIENNIGAFGILNFLFELNFFRLFSLVVLLPTYLRLRRQSGRVAFGQLPPDLFLLAYLALLFVLQLQGGNVTNALRYGFYLFIDTFLPYYVASRYLKDLKSYRDTLASLSVVAAVAGLIGVLEYLKGWLVYSPVPGGLGVTWGLGSYLNRGGSLRALASTGQPIVLGYLLAVVLCAYLYLRESISSAQLRLVGLLGIVGMLLAPLSRGPWIGAAIGYVVFYALGPNGASAMTKKAGIAFMLGLLVLASPYGATVIDHLPFIGTIDAENVDFRKDLLSNSLVVIGRNPWFGSLNYYLAPELEALRWGGDGGIIDVVNTYIAVTLGSGVVGLALFAGFLLSILWGTYKAMRAAAGPNSELQLLGRALLAAMACTLITIYTVSSISYIPILYWTLFGMGVSYQALVVREGRRKPVAAAPVQAPQAPTWPQRQAAMRRMRPDARAVPPPTPPAPPIQELPLPAAPASEADDEFEATNRAPLEEEHTDHAPLEQEPTQRMPLS